MKSTATNTKISTWLPATRCVLGVLCGSFPSILRALGGGDGQFDGEAGAFAFLAFDGDGSAVGGADGFDDRQAQAGAAELAGAGFVDAIETFKDVRLRLERNAHAAVRHFQDGLLRAGPGVHAHVDVAP